MANLVRKGEVTENEEGRKMVHPLVRRFVEAVTKVKKDFNVNEDVLKALQERLQDK